MPQRWVDMAKKIKPKAKAVSASKPKKAAKIPLKKAAKPVKGVKAIKAVVKAPVKSSAKVATPKKAETKPAKISAIKPDKKATKPQPVSKVQSLPEEKGPKPSLKPDVKQQAKAASKSKGKGKKAEKKDDDFDDDLIGDDFGDSEIAEYEDDLKAVEDDEDDLSDDLADDDDSDEKETEVYLTDSEGRRLCRVRDCDQISGVEGYCRYHYLLLWKKIQVRKSILLDGKLEKYIEDLTARYPDKFLEMIKKDMKSEKDFMGAIQELEIDESALGDLDNSDDEAQSFADEIRGVADAPAVDDDGDF